MPVYVYETILPDGTGGECFEIEHPMQALALKTHPESGHPVRRVYCAPNIGSKYSPAQSAKRLDNKNLEKAGFTKYVKDRSTGGYHKVAGKEGPSTLPKLS